MPAKSRTGYLQFSGNWRTGSEEVRRFGGPGPPVQMVIRIWLALAVLCAGTARGAGPSYSAAGIVNASNFTAGPFAPNSVISVFGAGLARSTHALADARPGSLSPRRSAGRCLPVEMNYVRVYVQDQPMPLLFVSDGQVNFLMSSVESAGPVKVRVVTEGITGPEITVTLVDAAPALFSMAGGYDDRHGRQGQTADGGRAGARGRHRGNLRHRAGADVAQPGARRDSQLRGLHAGAGLAKGDACTGRRWTRD